jgi:hypothetical protein
MRTKSKIHRLKAQAVHSDGIDISPTVSACAAGLCARLTSAIFAARAKYSDDPCSRPGATSWPAERVPFIVA